MIAVIADDFTGAAEIGGIGLRHDLDVVIETEPVLAKPADLLVIATDTRSMSSRDAAARIREVINALLPLKPKLIFKKVDSALRGHIAKEVFTQINMTEKVRAIVVAGNPAFKRTISNGQYYIDGVKLAETGFARDPHFPIRTSSVVDIVECTDDYFITNLKPTDELPAHGIIVGDVESEKDLRAWAAKLDKQTVMAGASGFFDALLTQLKHRYTKRNLKVNGLGKKALFILGSAFPKNMQYLKRMHGHGAYLANMPEEIYFNKNFDPSYLDQWAGDIMEAIHYNKVFATMPHSGGIEPGLANRLEQNMGELVKRVVTNTSIDELLIEGGGTAYCVLKYLNINRLIPVHEIQPGVIRMKIEGGYNFFLTTKPGSYPWPQEVLVSDNEQLNTIA